jgi:hypothetical protein
MIDWNATLYQPQYDILGADAVLTLVTGAAHSLRVIDMTAGVDVSAGSAIIADVKPVAFVMHKTIADLGLDRNKMKDARLLLNGTDWRVADMAPKPIDGKASGEFMLVLANEIAR